MAGTDTYQIQIGERTFVDERRTRCMDDGAERGGHGLAA
jgi:hypothetical protein